MMRQSYLCLLSFLLTSCASGPANQSTPKAQLPSEAARFSAPQIEAAPAQVSTSFAQVAQYASVLGNNIPTIEDMNSKLPVFAPLDPSKPCSQALFSSIAKLMRNHETMVLRKNGLSYDYYKDSYRVYFFQKNIAFFNTQSSIDYDRHNKGTLNSKYAGVRIDITHNENCTAAYVRELLVGTHSRGKYYQLSISRVDANFLADPDKGKVTQQYYRDFGFAYSRGRIPDFSYSCDEDTCKKL
jgi:hypothetical protein